MIEPGNKLDCVGVDYPVIFHLVDARDRHLRVLKDQLNRQVGCLDCRKSVDERATAIDFASALRPTKANEGVGTKPDELFFVKQSLRGHADRIVPKSLLVSTVIVLADNLKNSRSVVCRKLLHHPRIERPIGEHHRKVGILDLLPLAENMVDAIIGASIQNNMRQRDSRKVYRINGIAFFDAKNTSANSQIHERLMDLLTKVRVL